MDSPNILPFNHISVASNGIVKYIDDRRKHIIESFKTRWPKFNKMCMGGIESNVVYTIAGVSGAGKSAFANMIETDIIDLNPGKDVIVLSFSFEMLSEKQVGRKISSKIFKPVSELYSANEDLSDEDFARVKIASQRIGKYPIYYVDQPGSVEEIESTINYFYEIFIKPTNKYFIIILDHNLLVNRNGKSTLDTISDLQKLFIKTKKLPLTTIIQLSQMNRNIESPERINNPANHYPMRSDLSSADSIYQASDYVFCIHRPDLYNIRAYGLDRLVVKNKVYLHLLKIRDGEGGNLVFDNELWKGNLKECELEQVVD